MAASAHVLHCSKAAGNTSKAIEVVQDCATCLQVVRVSCGLGQRQNSGVVTVHQLGCRGICSDTKL